MRATEAPLSPPLSASDFGQRLLCWFDRYGRHDLPWQKNISPYRVWVSEIMLQQTQVTTVIPYFERFMQRFPDVATLAAAEQDEVLHLWTGLGYYARARNLHQAAKQVVNQHQGRLPHSVDGLCQLAGIGRSTAGAIVSIAQRRRAVILDGNVKRVLTRLVALDAPPSVARERQLWQLADTLTPDQRPADYTQAIMDLGATLCRRGQPDCQQCPFVDSCLAHSQGIAKQLPVGKKRKPLPEKSTYMLLLSNDAGELLLEQRPPAGLWGGLWCPPQLDSFDQLDSLLAHHGLSANRQQRQASFRHTFSHFHLDITPVLIEVSPSAKIADSDCRWVDPRHLDGIGLAAPVKKLLQKQSSATNSATTT